MPTQAEEIRRFLLHNIPQHPRDITRFTADAFDVARQTVSYHLRNLQAEGLVHARGRTSARRYSLAETSTSTAHPLDENLEEHVIWREFVKPALEDLPTRALDICHYGTTEMINNALDHSGGTTVYVTVTWTPISVSLTVTDDGVGVFRKIQEALDLPSPRDSVLELTKGKLTTDPEHHTGEGIFFTSRMFDQFTLSGNGLALMHLVENGDWFVEGWAPPGEEGTHVRMSIDPETERTATSVFDRFTSPDEEGAAFDVTHVPVALAAYGEENLISRSQARRVLARCNLFRRVVLDFHGVHRIGRAFADEMFRVFPQGNPDVDLSYMRAGREVETMIHTVMAARSRQLDLIGPS